MLDIIVFPPGNHFFLLEIAGSTLLSNWKLLVFFLESAPLPARNDPFFWLDFGLYPARNSFFSLLDSAAPHISKYNFDVHHSALIQHLKFEIGLVTKSLARY